MPDRDQFRRLPSGWRKAARALAAFGRGAAGQVDQELIDQAFVHDLCSGIQTLPSTLRVFEEFHQQPPLGSEIAMDRLARATRGIPRDRNDCLLHEEAERMLVARRHDPQQLLERFLQRSLRHNVIDSKGGVARILRGEGRATDTTKLLEAVAPTIQAKARQIRARPDFKRLRLETPRNRPIDLNANLLGGGL